MVERCPDKTEVEGSIPSMPTKIRQFLDIVIVMPISPIHHISYSEEEYPKLLREIPSPPATLFVKGSFPSPCICVAIVGTRKATQDGKLIAKQIAYDLAKAGITIVSGLAIGIDGAAHEGALQGGGNTIAVLANGLDTVYPLLHEHLAESIVAQSGAICSEYPEGIAPLRHQFLERNRIISGMSIATIVVEAPMRSGSLATARFALEQGREVFVVPGPVRHRNYQGSHMLIREGARLVTSAKDIAHDLEEALKAYEGVLAVPEKERERGHEEKETSPVFRAIKEASSPLTVDNISEMTHLETQRVNQELSLLILEGKIEELHGTFSIAKS